MTSTTVDSLLLVVECNRYGESFPVSQEVLDPSFTLPIGKAKVSEQRQVVVLHVDAKVDAWLFCTWIARVVGPGRVVKVE